MDLKQLYQIFLETNGVSTDTRDIGENSLFFALKGENFNGNKFAKDAIKKGASMAIIDDEQYCLNNDDYIVVEDVMSCLQQLANFHRKQLNALFLELRANGKTTTKELITAVYNNNLKLFQQKVI